MYQSDLKDDEWLKIKNDFNPSDKRGRKSKHDKKAIVDAILYVVKSGCQWRMMPKDFPPWVYDHFSRWNKAGVWECALDKLNEQYRHSKKKKGAPLCDDGLPKR
ncbi:transposase [Candidatus Hamiltonella defensa]|nr:transposase [Candidatus Hamiltonella defensa]MBK4361800.1 transposase [Candidatus Hamiltonella defensa]